MVTYNSTQKRAALRATLSSRGYHHEMLKEAPGRYVDMYWHRDIMNLSGAVDKPAGTIMPHQSTLKDTQNRLNVRGLTQSQVDEGYLSLLPWPPGADCSCKTCEERHRTAPTPLIELFQPEQETLEEHQRVGDGLCKCGYQSEASKKTSRHTAVFRHIRKERSAVTV